MTCQLRACGLGSEDRPVKVTLWSDFVTDHTIKVRKWMKSFSNNSWKSLDHRGLGSSKGFQPDTCWKGHKVGCKQYRFLEDVRNNFFIQELNGPTRSDIQLDVIFTKKKELLVDVIMSGSLGFSDNENNRV